MQRVETLAHSLIEKIEQKVSINELITIVKMLQSELLHLKTIQPATIEDNTAANVQIILPENNKMEQKEDSNEKTIEILQINEEDLEAELAEIKKNVEERDRLNVQNKPAIVFDEMDEIPTMAFGQQQGYTTEKNLLEVTDIWKSPVKIDEVVDTEINENVVETDESKPFQNNKPIKEELQKKEIEISEIIIDSPIKDLKKAISEQERFLYLNELFRGDETMYERSIKTINAFEIYPEAEFWIRRELKLKLGWDDKYQTVKQFDQLVRRRFSSM